MVLGNVAAQYEMRPCVVTDLDGTLWPLDTPRDKVAPPREVLEEMKRLGRLAVATSKDCRFATRVIPDAEAYVCVNGAEILTQEIDCLDREVVDKQEALLRLLESARRLDAYIEEKRSITGQLIGLSIDWLGRPRPDLSGILAEAASHGFTVHEPAGAHFVDIIASRRDKGFGVRFLRQNVCVGTPVIYIGDGENDIPGFMQADLRILVRHDRNTHLSIPGAVEVSRDGLADLLRRIKTEFNTTK